MAKNAKWFWASAMVLVAGLGLVLYYHRTSQTFEVTGEVLYKSETQVLPVAGARVEVFEDKVGTISSSSRYRLLLKRQLELKMSPEIRDPKLDVEFAALNLAPLGKMDWRWWETERLWSCRYASQFFVEGIGYPPLLARTSTDSGGHFWLELKRGRYFITAESEVPSFWRLEEAIHSSDTSAPVDGNAFWAIPVTVQGNAKVVSVEPDCSPY